MSPLPQLFQLHHFVFTDAIQSMARECFDEIEAHEGTLWLLDESRRFLTPVWNSGPQADQFVGTFRQPLDTGLISLACITEQAVCENEVCLNERQDPTLDRHLGLKTWSMIATPFVFNDALRGIISCVKLGSSADPKDAPPPFSSDDLRAVEKLSERLNQLIESESPKVFRD